MITIELSKELYFNLRVLVVAGAKSPHTDENAIMAAAQLLGVMHQAEQAAARAAAKGEVEQSNGRAAHPVSPPVA